VDRWLLAELDATVESVTAKFDDYAFSKARNELRSFFWNTFCDDYLEIAKQRLSAGGDTSTEFTLVRAHRTFLKLFAPFLPHVTEELWRRLYDADRSVHTTDWPTAGGYDADLVAGETAMEVVSALRRYKTERGLPLNADLEHVEVYGHLGGLAEAVAETMHVERLDTYDEAPDVTTEISDIDLDYSVVGPEFGSDVGAIDDAIASGEYEIDGDTLVVAGEFELGPDLFEIEESRSYSGEGEMTETENAVVVVRSDEG
jgi:valyl-tRNA synthetase